MTLQRAIRWTPDGVQRSKGVAGYTPRTQQPTEAASQLVEREKLAMSDAREEIAYRPYSGHTEGMVNKIDTKTGHELNMPLMIEDLHEQASQEYALAIPSSSGSGASSSGLPAGTIVPVYGTAESTRDVVRAITFYPGTVERYRDSLVPPTASGETTSSASSVSTWSTHCTEVASRQAAHMDSMDEMSRKFQERMAANLSLNQVPEERLEEMNLTPDGPPAGGDASMLL